MRETRVTGGSAVEVDLTAEENDILSSSEPSSKSADALANQKKEQGNKLFLQGSYAEAAKLYSEAIGLCAQPAFYTNRSQCAFRLGNYESALSDAQNAVQLDPKFAKGYLRIASCNIVYGDFDAARKNLLAAKEHADVRVMAEADRELVRLEAILKSFTEFGKCWSKEDWRGSVYYANKVIESCPRMYLLVAQKAEALVYNKKVDEALSLMSDVLRMDDKNLDAIFVRGLCFYFQDQFDKATTHFKRALQLSPDHSKSKLYWNKIKSIKSQKDEAGTLLKAGKVAEALALYSQVVKVDTTNGMVNSKIHFNIAVCLSKLKKPAQALDHLNTALSLDPDYVKAAMKRVIVYMELEMFEEAAREAEAIFKKEKTQHAKTLLDEAKVALKKSKQKDYYKILGVEKNASDDEIRKAYKKKALAHHPDRHTNSSDEDKKDNEKKFKDLGEAYAVLSDRTKKMRYDNGQDSQELGHDFGGHFDPSDIFASFFAGGGGGGMPGFGMGSGGGPSFTFTSGGGQRFSYQ